MSPARCPVCGAAGGACHGTTPFDPTKVISTEGSIMANENTKVYVPQQHVKHGVASYRGKDVVIVDKDGKTKNAPSGKKKSSD